MKPLSHRSSLLQTSPPCHHRHQQTRCLGPVQSLQSWTSCCTKVWIWRTKTRGGFLGNSTIRPGFQHQEITTQGTRCKAILRLEPPMYLIYQDPTSATWFPVAILVIPSMSTSQSWIDDRIKSTIEGGRSQEKLPLTHGESHLQIMTQITKLSISLYSPYYWCWWYKHKSYPRSLVIDKKNFFFPHKISLQYPCKISLKYIPAKNIPAKYLCKISLQKTLHKYAYVPIPHYFFMFLPIPKIRVSIPHYFFMFQPIPKNMLLPFNTSATK